MFDADMIYTTIYERTLTHLENQSKSTSFNRLDIEKELEALYIYEGHSWRGELKDAEISATIAAYQVFLNRNKE